MIYQYALIDQYNDNGNEIEEKGKKYDKYRSNVEKLRCSWRFLVISLR